MAVNRARFSHIAVITSSLTVTLTPGTLSWLRALSSVFEVPPSSSPSSMSMPGVTTAMDPSDEADATSRVAAPSARCRPNAAMSSDM